MSPAGDLLAVRELSVRFPIFGGILRHKIGEVRAVDGVSFDLATGDVLGLVGESGSGKTTVGRAIINILKHMSPNVSLGGSIMLGNGEGRVDLNGLSRREMLPFRSQVTMIFQDPYASLNPRMTVRQIIEGPLKIHTDLSKEQRKAHIVELLDRVGLQPQYMNRYPHEFSGGQRQRIGIARALCTHPKIIIADEPVSALDVSVQAQVINLMEELRQEFGFSYLFIAHDLSVVYHISNRIAVMYLGDIVEIGDSESVYREPHHPYSKALVSAVPQPLPERDRSGRQKLEGDIPTPLAKPSGCGFRTRCPVASAHCAKTKPTLQETSPGRSVACLNLD